MKPLRILMLEDDHFFANIVRFALEAEGWEVRHAPNGEEGLAMMREARPDAVLLDVAMPRKNGFEVLEEKSADDRVRDIPVIMLTELAAREDIARCMGSGACAYLIKSHVTPEEIAACVRKHATSANGFALRELLIVLGVIFFSGVMAYWQFGAFEARSRDARRLSNIRLAQSALAAAGEEGMTFGGCVAGDALASCKICRTNACVGDDDRTAQYLPRALFAPDDGEQTCAGHAKRPCSWAAENDGDALFAPGRVRIRYFQEKKSADDTGRRARVVLPDGRAE